MLCNNTAKYLIVLGQGYSFCSFSTLTLLAGNTYGQGRVSWSQPRLSSQESRVPVLPDLGVLPASMPTPFNTERPNSAW